VTHFHINAIDDQVEYKLYYPDELKFFEKASDLLQT
jgi:hypothetical protein